MSFTRLVLLGLLSSALICIQVGTGDAQDLERAFETTQDAYEKQVSLGFDNAVCLNLGPLGEAALDVSE
jgi:hypothetical protein